MELPDQVESLDAVPEPFHRFYSEGEGGFALDQDGFTGAVKNYDSILGEKKKATAKLKEYEAKLKAYDGIDDPEEARKAAEELRKLKDQLAAKDAGTTDEEVEKLLKARTQRMVEDHQATLTAKEKALKERDDQLAKLTDELANRVIDSEVALAATTDGFVPPALEDAVAAARRIFKLEDGKAVPRDADGQLMLGKDGEKPLTVKEWLEATKSSKPHWWKAQANGGGATGSDTGGGGGNTMSRAAFDKLTPEKKMAFTKGGGRLTE